MVANGKYLLLTCGVIETEEDHRLHIQVDNSCLITYFCVKGLCTLCIKHK